jgi:hypothetical protein
VGLSEAKSYCALPMDFALADLVHENLNKENNDEIRVANLRVSKYSIFCYTDRVWLLHKKCFAYVKHLKSLLGKVEMAEKSGNIAVEDTPAITVIQ